MKEEVAANNTIIKRQAAISQLNKNIYDMTDDQHTTLSTFERLKTKKDEYDNSIKDDETFDVYSKTFLLNQLYTHNLYSMTSLFY